MYPVLPSVSGMIPNARVLQADWVPAEIVHRTLEQNRLRDVLALVVDGGRSGCALSPGQQRRPSR
jgi:hypothetical protein